MSWATRFFWIIALAVAITCIYSVTLIRLGFAEPTVNLTEENITVTVPITLGNNGYYSIIDLNVTTLLTNVKNNRITGVTTYIPQIPPRNNSTILHNITLSVQEIMSNADYLFNDSSFTLYGKAQLEYANLIPFSFEVNTSIPWGAPLHNLTFGDPTYGVYNVTHLSFTVPISFDNHSPYFDVTGMFRIEVLNSIQQVVGEGALSVDVPSNSSYSGQLETVINPVSMVDIDEIHIYIETEMFNYGPIVINYG